MEHAWQIALQWLAHGLLVTKLGLQPSTVRFHCGWILHDDPPPQPAARPTMPSAAGPAAWCVDWLTASFPQSPTRA